MTTNGLFDFPYNLTLHQITDNGPKVRKVRFFVVIQQMLLNLLSQVPPRVVHLNPIFNMTLGRGRIVSVFRLNLSDVSRRCQDYARNAPSSGPFLHDNSEPCYCRVAPSAPAMVGIIYSPVSIKL